jgi:rod shape-determining protein MreC
MMMMPRRKLLDYVGVALLLLVPVAVLHANLKDDKQLNVVDQAVLRVSAPLQSGVSWLIEGVGGVWNRYIWLVDVQEENDELRRANARLNYQLATAKRRARHVDALEELVQLRRETPAETVGARVVASSVNPYFRVTRIGIDRGGAEVTEGMAVLNGDGLVGRIHRTYGEYSDVLLTIDPQSSIDVFVPRTGGRGVLTGTGDEASYASKIEYLERGEEVRVGDEVVTSGLGGTLPAHVLIGRVARVTSREYGLYQEVVVEPAVDFSSIGHVLVVLAPPPPPDPSGERDKASPAAYSLRPYQ